MIPINRYLATLDSPVGFQLLLTDAYGHVNSSTLLSPEDIQKLIEVLQAVRPIEVIDVEAVVVENSVDSKLEANAETPAAPAKASRK